MGSRIDNFTFRFLSSNVIRRVHFLDGQRAICYRVKELK
jgi:hypothetical protein